MTSTPRHASNNLPQPVEIQILMVWLIYTGKSSYFSTQKLLWLRFGFLIIHKAKKPDEVVQWIFYGYLVITFEIQKISIYGQPYPMLYMEIKITTCEF